MGLQSIGYPEVQRSLLMLRINIEPEGQAFLMDMAKAIYERANQLVPVRTGFLKSTINVLVEEGNISVMAWAFYAGFVEFGTSRMAPRPFMRPAVQEVANTLAGVLFFRRMERIF